MGAIVVGGGLAGSEAAWQLARQGIEVDLYEMRPHVPTAAHHSGWLGELVCSNSLRADSPENAAGLLKEELRFLNSLVLNAADRSRVPAGGALAVDREGFARAVTEGVSSHPLIRVHRKELDRIPGGDLVILATGPLTTGLLAKDIQRRLGTGYLHFFDAAAPLVTAESVNMAVAWWGARYDKGTPDYINCPLDEGQYHVLVDFLINATRHIPKIEGESSYFEGCMPVEEMARRGPLTLAYGPLKPVGLIDPRTGKRHFAVVQLRIDNRQRSLFNLVGFQTSLIHAEQRRMMTLIPGLEDAEIVRYGMMHQNSYIHSPVVLQATGACRQAPGLFFAGQLTGVEGYIESVASGLVAGINGARFLRGQPAVMFPPETAIGGLMDYIVTAEPDHFQPTNINWGLLPPLEKRVKQKKQRNAQLAMRARRSLQAFRQSEGI